MDTSTILSSRLVVLDRRRFLAAAGGFVAAGLLPSDLLALAAPHKFKQGAIDIIVISDGHLVFPTSILATNASPEALKEVLAMAGITGTEVEAATNVTLVRSGNDVVLFDAGSGGGFQPTAGKLPENLKSAGIEAADITKVVFTHAHPDHLWGVLAPDGKPAYPNASYYAAGVEWDFWMDSELPSKVPEGMRAMVTTTQKTFAPIKDRLTMLKPGDEVVGGIQVLDTPGHTPGHVSFEVPGGDGLIIMGDVANHTVVSFLHPEWHLAFDTIPDVAVATRSKLLDRAATDKVKMLGFHWPYPGLGHAERKGTAFTYVAAT